MSTPISRKWYPVMGMVILLAILSAGCTQAPPGPPPTTAPATPATTAPPTTTPPPTTPVPTTPTTAMTTPPVTTTAPIPTNPTPPAPVAITIQNFAFSPASVSVPTGATVTWTNQDAAPHQIASDTGAFMGSSLGRGSSYSFTFTTPGTYPYHCAIHPSMKGTITVT